MGAFLLSLVRRLLSSLRIRTGHAARVGLTVLRLFDYAYHLVVWSRISQGRFRHTAEPLPASTLQRKGVEVPPPLLHASNLPEADAFTEGFAAVYATLFGNLQNPGVLTRFRHARPGPAFRGVYLWDSAFIAQIWKHWDLRVAQETLQAVVDLRDGHRLQHVVAELVQSRFTQPPLVAWSAVGLGRTLRGEERIRFYGDLYEPLCQYHQWLDAHRRHPDGLYFWEHAYESGVENAPRFSNADESVLADTRQHAAPDLSAYVVLQLEALAEMSEALGDGQKEYLLKSAHGLRDAINDRLWCEQDGLYYDLDLNTGEHIRSRTIASLIPLTAGIPDASRAGRMLEWVRRTDGFGTPMPMPSVAPMDPSFEKDMWRGPVWLNTAYLGVNGLLRFGFQEDAGLVAYRLCEQVHLVYQTEGRIYEYYDPEALHTRDLRRKRGNWWKAFTLGTGPQRDFVGWTGLVNSLLIEVLCGCRWQPDSRSLELCPRFPEQAVGSCWRLELQVPKVVIKIERQSAGRHVVRLEGEVGSFGERHLGAGESTSFAI